MRQLAWLQATPRPAKGSKRAETFDADKALSRLAQAKKDGIEPDMPPNPAPHIVDRLVEMGLVQASGFGSAALSWCEIEAWQNNVYRLPPWEARLMHRLSQEYVNESRRAGDENCGAPWLAAASDATIRAEMRLLDDVLG